MTAPAVSIRVRRGGSALAPPLLVGLIVLTVWQLSVQLSGVQSFILPAPSTIVQALADNGPQLISAARVTTLAIGLGMLMGTTAGVVAALGVAAVSSLARPLVVAAAVLNSAPIVALAPIFNAWFGATSLLSKAAVAALMVFFPVFVNSVRGLLQVDPLHQELMRSLSASRRQLMTFVRVPGALPSCFDGMRIGSTLCVIGVIVAEYFGGPSEALGVYIANEAALSRFASTWAGVVVASAVGLSIFGLVVLAERLALPWRDSAVPDDT